MNGIWTLKTLMILAVLALILVGAPALMAGEYHYGASLKCAECHVMHYSQQHGYNADGTGPINTPVAGGPFGNLLRADGTNNLCLTCHDGSTNAYPDVFETNEFVTPSTYVRAGGALNDTTSDGTGGYHPTDGHTLNSPDPPPGWDGGAAYADTSFDCADCHDPHGTIDYRNLDPAIGESTGLNVYYEKAATNGAAVFLRSGIAGVVGAGDGVATPASVPTNYAVSVMDLQEPAPDTASAIGAWCGGCHGDYHGSSTDGNMNNATDWVRHPTADANIGGGDTGGTNLELFADGIAGVTKTTDVKVMDPTSLWDGTSTNLTPTCLSCHKAHGNQNPFGLVYMGQTGTITEEGTADGVTTGAESLCHQCHGQGTSFVPTP